MTDHPARTTRDARGAVHSSRRTGRHLVLLRQEPGCRATAALQNATGVRMGFSADLAGSKRGAHLEAGQGLLFESVGVALLHADSDQSRALRSHAEANRLWVEPERFVGAAAALPTPAPPFIDSAQATWGLRATGTLCSPYTGRGIRIAILDTGLALQHPDFTGRRVVSQSFVADLSVDDQNGHGTHCAGVACGLREPAGRPRYGVASDAELYVGRILDDDASGTDGGVLAGIDWAVRNGAVVVSMSLGTPVLKGDPYSPIFEQVAFRALAAGSLLIAPAGNESARPDTIVPVGHPANCPSILAVGAVDSHLGLAPFSNGGLNSGGGEVDLVAPGIAVLSAVPGPMLYRTGSGTSIAASFAAGIAALLAEANPCARGAELRSLLRQSLQTLPFAVRDVGAGLVRAPRSY